MKSHLRPISFAVALLLAGCSLAYGQANAVVGSLEVTAKPAIGTKQEPIERKRFYLFRGGLEANNALIEKLKTSNATSRDCFYCELQVSQEYIAWLKAGDCESAYCREITADDLAKVPEFKAAYQKSLVQYGNKPSIAQKWLVSNLAPNLRNGFYEERKSFIDRLLGSVKPIQSAVTDSFKFKAVFIDVPLKESKATEKFLISNIVPIEIGEKSYLWACEVEIGSEETATLELEVPEKDKPVQKCEVIIKDLRQCRAGSCPKK